MAQHNDHIFVTTCIDAVIGYLLWTAPWTSGTVLENCHYLIDMTAWHLRYDSIFYRYDSIFYTSFCLYINMRYDLLEFEADEEEEAVGLKDRSVLLAEDTGSKRSGEEGAALAEDSNTSLCELSSDWEGSKISLDGDTSLCIGSFGETPAKLAPSCSAEAGDKWWNLMEAGTGTNWAVGEAEPGTNWGEPGAEELAGTKAGAGRLHYM